MRVENISVEPRKKFSDCATCPQAQDVALKVIREVRVRPTDLIQISGYVYKGDQPTSLAIACERIPGNTCQMVMGGSIQVVNERDGVPQEMAIYDRAVICPALSTPQNP